MSKLIEVKKSNDQERIAKGKALYAKAKSFHKK